MRIAIAAIVSVSLAIICGMYAVPAANNAIYGERSVVPFKGYSLYPPGAEWPPMNPYAQNPPLHWVLWCCVRTIPSLLPSAAGVAILVLACRRHSIGLALALGLVLSITQTLTLAALLIYDDELAFYTADLPQYSLPTMLATTPLGAVSAAVTWLLARCFSRRSACDL
jgi:hypothetical protein